MFIIKVIFKSDSSMLCVNLTLLYPNTFLILYFYIDTQSAVIVSSNDYSSTTKIVFADFESANGFVA
jgi:hypothetical protein